VPNAGSRRKRHTGNASGRVEVAGRARNEDKVRRQPAHFADVERRCFTAVGRDEVESERFVEVFDDGHVLDRSNTDATVDGSVLDRAVVAQMQTPPTSRSGAADDRDCDSLLAGNCRGLAATVWRVAPGAPDETLSSARRRIVPVACQSRSKKRLTPAGYKMAHKAPRGRLMGPCRTDRPSESPPEEEAAVFRLARLRKW
jgi:hypothetical protein